MRNFRGCSKPERHLLGQPEAALGRRDQPGVDPFGYQHLTSAREQRREPAEHAVA